LTQRLLMRKFKLSAVKINADTVQLKDLPPESFCIIKDELYFFKGTSGLTNECCYLVTGELPNVYLTSTAVHFHSSQPVYLLEVQ
jgi:hypothetical protein